MVPADLRGLFLARQSLNEEGWRITGLRLQPDAALEAMNDLLERIGKPGTIFRHGDTLSRLYEGEAFARILRDGLEAPELEAIRSVKNDVTRDGRRNEVYYEKEGIDYADSYRLSDALRLSDLAVAEKELVRSVYQRIPEDVRGAFTCDLVRHQGALRVHCIAIAPNLTGKAAAETVLKPAADSVYEEYPNAARDNAPGLLGIKTHWRTMVLERDAIEQISRLPSGRAREA